MVLYDDTYNIIYEPTANGTMDIEINEYANLNGIIETVKFNDVPLTLDNSYTQTVSADIIDENDYTLTADDGTQITESSVETPFHIHESSEEWQELTLPTCTETGLEYNICDICFEWYYRVIDEVSHTYVHSVIEPTCTTDGYTSHTCSVCGTSYTDTVTSKTGHYDDDGDGYCDKCNTDLGSHEPDDPSANCSCNCHKSGIVKFFWKIANFFHKLFKMEKYHYCDCGNPHW